MLDGEEREELELTENGLDHVGNTLVKRIYMSSGDSGSFARVSSDLLAGYLKG